MTDFSWQSKRATRGLRKTSVYELLEQTGGQHITIVHED